MPHESIFPMASGGGDPACDVFKSYLISIFVLYKFKILPVENNLQFKSGRNDRMVPLQGRNQDFHSQREGRFKACVWTKLHCKIKCSFVVGQPAQIVKHLSEKGRSSTPIWLHHCLVLFRKRSYKHCSCNKKEWS